jgi:outer membrane protein assembly factor BamB
MKTQCRICLAVPAIAVLLAGSSPVARAWTHAHGNSANDGYADVRTSPAGTTGSLSIPNIGTFSPGAGPVIGCPSTLGATRRNNFQPCDGIVYLGNQDGTFFAFHSDGTPAWNRHLPGRYSIVASPVVGLDGSVYVVGTSSVRDHRETPTIVRTDSMLFKFSADGDTVWSVQLPQLPSGFPTIDNGGYTAASPNIWISGGTEVLMLTSTYKSLNDTTLHLYAISADGVILADTIVTRQEAVLSGSSTAWDELYCIVTFGFGDGCTGHFYPGNAPLPAVDTLRVYQLPPLDGTAIYTYPGGGTPWVMVADGKQDVVGYTFSLEGGFQERFRVHDAVRSASSLPVVLPDAHTVLGTDDGRLTFAGPNQNGVPDVKVGASTGVEALLAPPTRTQDSRIIAVKLNNGIAVVQGNTITSTIPLSGQSMASAAASRTHIFISTASAFLSYDAATLAKVAEIDWEGGGLSPPAIGPDGRVYAIASNILFIFPPPAPCANCMPARWN